MSTATVHATSARVVAGHAVRPPLVVAAVVVLGVTIALAVVTGAPWWLVAIGLIGPDLTFLAAIGDRPTAPGLMPRRAVLPYNLAHHPAGPAVLLAAAAVWASAPAAVLALAWAAHLVWDRSVGYGLRARDGSQLPTGN